MSVCACFVMCVVLCHNVGNIRHSMNAYMHACEDI